MYFEQIHPRLFTNSANQWFAKTIMDRSELELNLNTAVLKLKDMTRQTLVRTVVAQAISLGLVTREHPESPRHPRQRYLLTDKGLKVLLRLGCVDAGLEQMSKVVIH